LIQVLGRNGGGIFHGTCTKLQKASSQCYWVGISTSREATMAVIENNTAYGKNVIPTVVILSTLNQLMFLSTIHLVLIE
jgi:hypothetical protein